MKTIINKLSLLLIIVALVSTGCSSDDENSIPEIADTTVWTGQDILFFKNSNQDWTLAANQDSITPSVSFTRQNNRPLYNYQWWQDQFGEDPSGDDLQREFRGGGKLVRKDVASEAELTFTPSGGTQGVRWAILDDTGFELDWDTSNFTLYGELGQPDNFYSLNNITAIFDALNSDVKVVSVKDDFTVETADGDYSGGGLGNYIVGKKLACYIEKDSVYFTITFLGWVANGNGGSMSYQRSTKRQ